MKAIAVIPARGGSKRIPRKNIRSFAGKPMIAWSIEAARASGVFSDIVVSTDCPEIAEISRAHGASVPFLRPPELSGDTAPFMPVIRLHLQHLALTDVAFAIYATAPFLKPERLVEGMQALSDQEVDFVLSVTAFPSPVQRSLRLDATQCLSFAEPENALKRSQELEPRYHDVGQFLGGRVGALREHDAVLFGKCRPVFIPRVDAVDIDTEEDWEFAEKLHALRAK